MSLSNCKIPGCEGISLVNGMCSTHLVRGGVLPPTPLERLRAERARDALLADLYRLHTELEDDTR